MKKLLTFILLATLFAACGDDDDDITYLDNKLIEGSWYRIEASDSVVVHYKNNEYRRTIIDKYTGYVSSDRSFGPYKLTETEIIYTKSSQPYKLDKDSIWLYNIDQYIKYIKVKE